MKQSQMDTLKAVADKLGWRVDASDGMMEIEKNMTHGLDIVITVNYGGKTVLDDAVRDIGNFIREYNPDTEAELYIRSDVQGKPPVREIVEDCEEAKKESENLLDALSQNR